MNAPKFTFSEQDNTLGVGSLAKGISGFQGKFLRGPYAQPDQVIFNWQQFIEIYGGFSPDSTDPILVYRALNSGANLRVSRIGHYSDLTDKESLTAEKARLKDSYVLIPDRTTATGSTFTAGLNGNFVTVQNTDTHEAFMQEIAVALTIPNLSEAFVLNVNGIIKAIHVCPINAFTNLNFTSNPLFSGSINGPSEPARTQVTVPSAPAPGTLYRIFNVTKNHFLASYFANPGDTVSQVAQGLRTNADYPGYTYGGSGPNIDIDAPLNSPYATFFNGDVIQLSEFIEPIAEQRAFVTYQITVGGIIGEIVTVTNAEFGGTLATYTIDGSAPTLSSIAAAINTGGSGCVASAASGTILIFAPPGYGDLANGEEIVFTSDEGVFQVTPTSSPGMTNGVTAVAGVDLTYNFILEDGVNGGTGNPSLSISSDNDIRTSLGIRLFRARPKSEGPDGNNIFLRITDSSNGAPAYFNMIVEHALEPGLTETYQNLLINPNDTSDTTFLNQLNEVSSLLTFTFTDLSEEVFEDAYPRPINGRVRYGEGTNGDPIELTDYIGSQTGGTGFHAFSQYNDMMQFCAGEVNHFDVHEAGASYANTYQNMVYLGHIDHTLTYTQMIAAMEASSIDTSWAAFYTGGLNVKHPATGASIQISEIGDVLGAFARSDEQYGEGVAVFNKNRGLISSTTGAIKNFGGAANYEILNALANNRINCVVTEDGTTMIWGNTTAQRATSVLQFLNIRRLGLAIKKTLSPVLREYLSEPNIPATWFEIFVRVKPYLDGLVQKSFLYSYEWKGDQLANPTLNNLVVNSPADVQAGKYKAILSASAVPGMNEFELVLTYDFTTGTVDLQTA
jgi:hypothetical protein